MVIIKDNELAGRDFSIGQVGEEKGRATMTLNSREFKNLNPQKKY